MTILGLQQVMFGIFCVAGYLIVGLYVSVQAFERRPFDLWIEYRSLAAQYFILLTWPLAVPVCLFLAWRWWRSA